VYALSIGASLLEIGLVCGLSPVIYTIFAAFAGFFLQRIREGKAVLLSMFLLLFYFILPFTSSVYFLAVVALILVLGYAIFWPAVESIISHIEGSVSKFSTSWSTGSLVGSLLVSPLLLLGIRKAFIALGLTSLASLLLTFNIKVYYPSTLPSFKKFLNSLSDIPWAWLWAFSYSTAQGVVFTYYPVIVEVLGFSTWLISLSLFSTVFFRTLVFVFYSKLPRYLRNSTIAGLLILFPSILPFTNNPVIVSFASIMLGIGAGILYNNSLENVFKSSKESRVIYTSLFESFIGLGYSIGPILAGVVSTLTTLHYTILSSTILALTTVLIGIILKTT